MRAPTGIYHPLFATHPRHGLETSMTDRIEIREPSGDVTPNWVPGVGIPSGAYTLVYRGPARVQPNLDWRARDRNHSGDLNATEDVRVQIPFGKNEVGAVLNDDAEIISYGPDPLVTKDYMISIIASSVPTMPWLTGYTLIVRNAIEASQKWIRNFLASTGTKGDG